MLFPFLTGTYLIMTPSVFTLKLILLSRRVLVLLSSTTGMSVVIGLGDDDQLYDWFLPEEKRPDLPLERTTGITLYLWLCVCGFVFVLV